MTNYGKYSNRLSVRSLANQTVQPVIDKAHHLLKTASEASHILTKGYKDSGTYWSNKKYWPKYYRPPLLKDTIPFRFKSEPNWVETTLDYLKPTYVDSLNSLNQIDNTMPPRKRYNKKGRKRGRKWQVKRGKSHAKGSTSIVQTGTNTQYKSTGKSFLNVSGFAYTWPRQLMTKFKSQEFLDTVTGVTQKHHIYQLTSCYDPFATESKNQPYEWHRFTSSTGPYLKHYVYGGSFQLHYTNFSATYIPMEVNYWISTTSDVPASYEYITGKEGVRKIIVRGTSANPVNEAYGSWSTRYWLHDHTLASISGTYAANPTDMLYLHVWVTSADGTTNLNYKPIMRLYQHTVMHDRYDDLAPGAHA